MAKKAKSSGNKATRGPAREIRTGDGGVGKTQAGKPRAPHKGSTKNLTKVVPGAVKGV